jgi:hypothetical protein
MSKSCRCFWADEDGTCSMGEDPPVQETCPHQADRIDPMTGKIWPSLNLDPPQEKKP